MKNNDYMMNQTAISPNAYGQGVPSQAVAYNSYTDPQVMREMANAGIEIQKNDMKASIDVNRRLAILDGSYRIKEKHRAIKDAQYEDLFIDTDGTVMAITRNSIIQEKLHKICNFSNPKLIQLRSTDGEEGISVLKFGLSGRNAEVYLLEHNLGVGKYILRKIRSAGGDFMANKESRAERYAVMLLAKLRQRTELKIIPAHMGWVEDGKQKLNFAGKGGLTWIDILKKAK